MDTVSIRNLRGEDLRDRAHRGKLLGITNRRELIGVVIPVTAAWVEHLIDYNWSHVRQSLAEGEQAIAEDMPMATLDDVVTGADAVDKDDWESHGPPGNVAGSLAVALVGGTVTHGSDSREALERLHTVLNPSRSSGDQAGAADEPSIRTVRIGELRADLIEKAAVDGQTLAITHDRELIGLLIPVTRGLVQFLIEQNMSRVLYNIGLGEKQASAGDKLTTLDEVLEGTAPTGTNRPAPSLAPGDDAVSLR
jgi:hypothetical protein